MQTPLGEISPADHLLNQSGALLSGCIDDLSIHPRNSVIPALNIIVLSLCFYLLLSATFSKSAFQHCDCALFALPPRCSAPDHVNPESPGAQRSWSLLRSDLQNPNI